MLFLFANSDPTKADSATKDLVLKPLQLLLEQLTSKVPMVLGALALLLGAWLAARLARALVARSLGLTKLDEATDSTFVGRVLRGFGEEATASKLLGTAAYYAILLLGVTGATDLVGLSAVRGALNGMLGYLPRVASAAVVIVIGGYLASAARRALGAVLAEMKSGFAGVAESAVEIAIIAIALAISADVLGVDLSLITGNLAIVLGAVLVTVCFLCCWSMRRPAEEILANYYLRRLVAVGDRVKLGEAEGKVVRFVPLGLVLREAGGEEIFVPARHVLDGLRRTPASR